MHMIFVFFEQFSYSFLIKYTKFCTLCGVDWGVPVLGASRADNTGCLRRFAVERGVNGG